MTRQSRPARIDAATRAHVAIILLAAVAITTSAYAQQPSSTAAMGPASGGPPGLASTGPLEEVVVTGTLIPDAQQKPIALPLTVITLEDMQQRGFTSVADALEQSTFATGGVEGPQFTNGFTPGARTLSMFGLPPGYVKYLLDGRPMSQYPALYEATQMITNLGGVPMQLVDHIDVIPGGQSSLYGSDAIAGVVNIVLKKNYDVPLVDLRYGFYKDGGGVDKSAALADSFQLGLVSLLAGVPLAAVQFALFGSMSAARCCAYCLESRPATGIAAKRGSPL